MHYCWVEDTNNTSTFSDNSIASGPSAKIKLMIEREEGVDALVAESKKRHWRSEKGSKAYRPKDNVNAGMRSECILSLI